MREGEPRFEEESQIYASGKSPDAKEPTLEKETPPEGQEPQNEREVKWKEAEQNLEKFGDIEKGIADTVVGLNVFGIETVNSCEGHYNHGRIAPWVSIEKWESKPREKYVGQKEFEQQVYERLGVVEINQKNWDYIREHDEMAASFLPPGQVEFGKLSEDNRRQIAERDEELMKKYGITPEVTKQWMDAGMQAEKEIEQAGKDGRLQETEEYKKWKAENDAMKSRAQQLLDEFYQDKKVPKGSKITIDQDGSGLWCIHNGGKDYYDVTRRQDEIPDKDKKHYQKILDEKNPEKAQRDTEKRVAKYRAEFQEFANFLKDKYFSESKTEDVVKIIAETEPIQESRGTMIRTKDQIKELVEVPLLPACEELYDKNIQTLSTSANKKDLEAGQPGYIILDFKSLSEENRKIAEQLGKLQHAENSDDPDQILIKIPLNQNTTIEEIRDSSMSIADKFKKQPMTWAPTYSLEELRGFYSDPEAQVEDFTGSYYYDSDKKIFYLSEEHFKKANEKMK